MKVELKPVTDQLTELMELGDGLKVSACFDGEDLVGWTVVRVSDDGAITPVRPGVQGTLSDLYKTKGTWK